MNQNVQYQINRMSVSRDICRKPDFGPNLGRNGPNFGPKFVGQHIKGGCSRCGLVRFGLSAYIKCVFKCGFIYPCQKNILNCEPKRGFFV